MKVLYINTDRGYGIYQIGLLFLDIIKLISPIHTINVYTTQCCNQAKKYIPEHYDLVIINEYNPGCIDDIIPKFKNTPIINIAHSQHNTPNEVLTIGLNHETNWKKGIFSLDFVPGNIWENKHKSRKGTMMACRICKEKIPLELLPKDVDIYGPVLDYDLVEKIKYSGFCTPLELVDMYNQYSQLLVISNTECLCMPIREALLCGCTPIVYDPDRVYTSKISDYIQYYNEPLRELKPFPYRFEDMVLQFLFYLRAITGRKLILKKDNKTNITYLHSQQDRELYTYNIFNEDLLWKTIENNG